jgi:hypothetical protein
MMAPPIVGEKNISAPRQSRVPDIHQLARECISRRRAGTARNLREALQTELQLCYSGRPTARTNRACSSGLTLP